MRDRIILASLFLIFLALRLYQVTAPLCDHAAGRQIPTADVALNYYQTGMHMLQPKLSGFGPDPVFIESECHILPYLTAAAYHLFGVHETLGRLIAVLFSAFSFFIFYKLAEDRIGRSGALYALFFFTFAPFSVYFSRVFMPEPVMLCFSLAALFTFSRWIEGDRNFYFMLAAISSALAFLSKIPTLYLLLPIGYLALSRWGISALKRPKLWLYFALSILPAAAYYFYAYRMGLKSVSFGIWDPGYGAFSKWMDLKTITDSGFYAAILERVATVGVTPAGLGLAAAGLLIFMKKKEMRFVYVWLAALILYTVVLARGNLANDYYQVPVIPVLCLFMAGPFVMLEGKKLKIIWLLLPVFAALSLYYLPPLYEQDTWALGAGRSVAELTPRDSLVVANTPMTLYYARRQGWKVHYSSPERIREYIQKGAQYLVTTRTWPLRNNQPFLRFLTESFRLIKQTREYLLFDLIRKGSAAGYSKIMSSWRLSDEGFIEAQMPVKTERPVFQLKLSELEKDSGPWILAGLIDGKKAFKWQGILQGRSELTWRARTRIGMHRVGIQLKRHQAEKSALPAIQSLKVLKSK